MSRTEGKKSRSASVKRDAWTSGNPTYKNTRQGRRKERTDQWEILRKGCSASKAL